MPLGFFGFLFFAFGFPLGLSWFSQGRACFTYSTFLPTYLSKRARFEEWIEFSCSTVSSSMFRVVV